MRSVPWLVFCKFTSWCSRTVDANQPADASFPLFSQNNIHSKLQMTNSLLFRDTMHIF